MLSFPSRMLPLSVAVSISLASFPVAALAGPGDINSVNNGPTVHGGTYDNTPGSRTTFQNLDGSLYLHKGELVRGIETDASKNPTGNGGAFYFRAPNGVIRIDGDIDVSAIRNGKVYVGNGGKVYMDSPFLFQNGNIFANGVNGGLVQLNVGGMTMGSNAKITANGFGGDGGSVNVNATGAVNIAKGALIDTSGQVVGTFDTNVINIEGGAVNNAGILRANGVATADFKPDNGDQAIMAAHPQLANNPVPGPISAGSGTHDTSMTNILFFTPGNANFRGGTIRLVATGQGESPRDLLSPAAYANLSRADREALDKAGSGNAGNVSNTGIMQADGAFNKNGGTILVSAAHDVTNKGLMLADGASATNGVFDAQGNGASGGNGGTISVNAMHQASNEGLISAFGGQGGSAKSIQATTANGQDALAQVQGHAGQGGQGGLIAFSAPKIGNNGIIYANGGVGGQGGNAVAIDSETNNLLNPTSKATAMGGAGGSGGQGGLVVFSGDANPTGHGIIVANGGQGGLGGNAIASVHATSNLPMPTVQAQATHGAGGSGGSAGQIVSPNPNAFAHNQFYAIQNGGLGNSGSTLVARAITRNGLTLNSVNGSLPTLGSVVSGPNHAILATRKNEYLRHEETALLLSQDGGVGNANATLSGRLSDALIRTVSNPNGAAINTLADAESAGNLVIASTGARALTNDLVNSNINPLFFNLNTLTILNNGDVTNNTLWTPGVHVVGAGFHDISFSLGGGHISWLANGTITNNKIVMTRGLWTGGSTQVAAKKDIINNSDFINIGPNRVLLEGFAMSGPLYQTSHAGSLTLKAGRDIVNASTGKIETNRIFYDIHPPLNQNPPIDWPRFLNGAQIGATVNLLAHRNLTNAGIIGADAMTYRNGALGAQNPALTTGGMIIGRAKTGTVTNTGTITANGNAFFSPNETDDPRFNTNTFPATTSFNGTIDIR